MTKFIVDSLPSCRHYVLSFNNDGNYDRSGSEDIIVERIPTDYKLLSQPVSLQYSKRIKSAISEWQPDVVYFHYPNPLGAYLVLRHLPRHIPLVVHWHSDIVQQKVVYPLFKNLEHRLLSRADVIVATSESYANASRPLRPFLSKHRVIPCSVNTSSLTLSDEGRERVERLRRDAGGRPIVFFIGRHVKYKGLPYLLEAEKLMKNDHLVLIAGTGKITEGLKERYKEREEAGAIRWLGRIPDEDIPVYLHAADIFAFPSITRNEAFGVALAEAMYCGTPAVTFEIPRSGVNWVSPDAVSSLCVENSNVGEYARALDRLITDDALRESLGETGQRRVSELFSEQAVARLYRELMDDIASGKIKKS